MKYSVYYFSKNYNAGTNKLIKMTFWVLISLNKNEYLTIYLAIVLNKCNFIGEGKFLKIWKKYEDKALFFLFTDTFRKSGTF